MAEAFTPAPELDAGGPDLSGPGWDKRALRSLLEAQGIATHSLIAVGPKLGVESDEWKWLDDELDTIVPALARIMNRIPAARAAAAGGDAFAVGFGFLGYGARSVAERQALIALARQDGGPPAVVVVDPGAAPTPADAADAGDGEALRAAGMVDVPPLGPRGR